MVAVRLRGSGREWMDERIAEFDVTQTELVKAALAFAASKPTEFAKLVIKRKESN